ncbi:MAG: type 1 glutamine amidotransferase [Thaumarchaeota archaeon]|nr:type 1 glutamine amidotransferase [Nitrososphaerota archaeon]
MTGPNILVVQNAEWEGPALIRSHSRAAGTRLSVVRMFASHGPSTNIPLQKLENGSYAAVVSLGSPSTAYRPDTNPRHDDLVELFKLIRKKKIPSFNVCYSMQLFSLVHGGKVAENPAGKEVGFFEVYPSDAGAVDPVFGSIGRHVTLQWHGDIVEALPPGAVHLASSKKTKNQAAVVDGIHYLVQGDGQAATPSMVRSWMRHDAKWATEGTGLNKEDLLREAVKNEAFLRNTFLRTFGNFVALVVQWRD